MKTHDESFALVQKLWHMNDAEAAWDRNAQLTIAPSYSSNNALENSASSRMRPLLPEGVLLISMTVYFSSSAPLMERAPAG